jgi:hypothetical protein
MRETLEVVEERVGPRLAAQGEGLARHFVQLLT